MIEMTEREWGKAPTQKEAQESERLVLRDQFCFLAES